MVRLGGQLIRYGRRPGTCSLPHRNVAVLWKAKKLTVGGPDLCHGRERPPGGSGPVQQGSVPRCGLHPALSRPGDDPARRDRFHSPPRPREISRRQDAGAHRRFEDLRPEPHPNPTAQRQRTAGSSGADRDVGASGQRGHIGREDQQPLGILAMTGNDDPEDGEPRGGRKGEDVPEPRRVSPAIFELGPRCLKPCQRLLGECAEPRLAFVWRAHDAPLVGGRAQGRHLTSNGRCDESVQKDVVSLPAGSSLADCLEVFARTRHTRYPVCEGPLERTLGIAHVKDFVGATAEGFDLRSLLRPALRVPGTLPIGALLRHFQETHQHMALVVDEYGTVIGLATLETVLEQIVGPVEDEFDDEVPAIVEELPGRFLVRGTTPLESVAEELGLEFEAAGADTFSGYLVARAGRLLKAGERFSFEGFEAEVLEARNGRATRLWVTIETPAVANHDEAEA